MKISFISKKPFTSFHDLKFDTTNHYISHNEFFSKTKLPNTYNMYEDELTHRPMSIKSMTGCNMSSESSEFAKNMCTTPGRPSNAAVKWMRHNKLERQNILSMCKMIHHHHHHHLTSDMTDNCVFDGARIKTTFVVWKRTFERNADELFE